jgi:hypothetical protein
MRQRLADLFENLSQIDALCMHATTKITKVNNKQQHNYLQCWFAGFLHFGRHRFQLRNRRFATARCVADIDLTIERPQTDKGQKPGGGGAAVDGKLPVEAASGDGPPTRAGGGNRADDAIGDDDDDDDAAPPPA